MKRLALFLLACSAFAACPNPITNGYTYCRMLTVTAASVPATQTNFPVGLWGTAWWLKSTAYGGHVTNSNGYDVVFTSDAAGTMLLTWEPATYNAVTGQYEYWVKIPSLSSSADTVFYMYYGNTSITTSQTTATSTWDANYIGVWHFGDGTTLSLADSTSNANNLTSVAPGPTAVMGKVGGAGYTSTILGSYFEADGTKSNISGTALTIEAWGNFQGIYINGSLGGGASLVYKKTPFSTQGFEIELAAADSMTNTPNKFYYQNESGGPFLTDTQVVPSASWVHMEVTYGLSGTANHADLLRNGVLLASGLVGTGFPVTSTGNLLRLGNGWTGPIDEIRLSNTNRTLGWIQTGYNNQNNPNFVGIGGEVPATGAGTVVIQ